MLVMAAAARLRWVQTQLMRTGLRVEMVCCHLLTEPQRHGLAGVVVGLLLFSVGVFRAVVALAAAVQAAQQVAGSA